MNPEELLRQMEVSGDIRGQLLSNKKLPGICAAYMSRILDHYAEDIGRADHLAMRWRLFRDFGDDPALAYRAKGIHERIQGRWLASARAFQKSGEMAQDPINKFSFVTGAIDGLARAGRTDEAQKCGLFVAQGLDELNRPDLAARARLNMGNALLWAERGEEARKHYSAAIFPLQQGGFVSEEASARLGLSTTHLYGGDPKVARAEAEAAKSIAQQNEMNYLSALCDINLAHLSLLEGHPDEAYSSLLASRTSFADSPSDLARAHEFVGDACLRLNLFTEARESYQLALDQRNTLSKADQAHVWFGLGESQPDIRIADSYLALAASKYKKIGNLPWFAAATAARSSRQPTHKKALRWARESVSSTTSPYHLTLAYLALAKALLARGIVPSDEFTQIEKLVRRYGYRRFVWQIFALKARASNRPLPHYRRMIQEIMVDRLATSSVAARAGFLADKSAALGEYFAELLSNPTSARVVEIRNAIRQTRAATLFDEIIMSGSGHLNSAALKRLEELRFLVIADAEQESTHLARGTNFTNPPKRLFTEATHIVGALDRATPPEIIENCVVFVEAAEKLWAVVEEKAFLLPISSGELRESLAWLRFEMRSAAGHHAASPMEALTLLCDLRDKLITPWLVPEVTAWHICPDGDLWQVPWDALMQKPVTILLHPSFGGGTNISNLSRVAIWSGPGSDIPHAGIEEKIVLDKFPSASVFRTRGEVMASLDQKWDLVHVVCHAKHNPENPMFSTLEFKDGPIFAAHIARSRLRTRFVCLSACETGMISVPNFSEPDGLARAFLAKGSEAVLASLWPLDDEAASRFFRKLYSCIDEEENLGSLISLAREDVRAWRDHPYFWAPFALFSGYQK